MNTLTVFLFLPLVAGPAFSADDHFAPKTEEPPAEARAIEPAPQSAVTGKATGTGRTTGTSKVGPRTPMCGGEISQRVKATLNQVIDTVNKQSSLVTLASCENAYGMMTDWDMALMSDAPGRCGASPCQDCFEFNGKKQWRWDINYALFGLAMSLCKKTYQQAIATAFAWKTLKREWSDNVENWIHYGYYRSFSVPLTDNPRFKNCPACDHDCSGTKQPLSWSLWFVTSPNPVNH